MCTGIQMADDGMFADQSGEASVLDELPNDAQDGVDLTSTEQHALSNDTVYDADHGNGDCLEDGITGEQCNLSKLFNINCVIIATYMLATVCNTSCK